MLTYKLNRTKNYKSVPKLTFASKIFDRYIAYCDAQESKGVYWYMKGIILLTCVYMVPSITVMAMATDYYVYYVGFTMVLFYGNVMAHMMKLRSRYFVPIYHMICLLMILIPAITALIFGFNGSYV